MSVPVDQLVNRIAYLFGEVQSGNNPVLFIKLNPKDAAVISEHITRGAIWGATVKEDLNLRPGTCIIDQLGKRPLY